ncbi:hypothetical protein H311_00163 [Anncaliia algerae PRA109]|nr:hypothetical protein H311_00163 [Anncaliia algerae PRA109]
MDLVNHLTCISKSLSIVKTKDSKEYKGIVISIDGNMNILMRNVELTYKKNITKINKVLIKGSDVRYFTIEDNNKLKKIINKINK